MKVDCPRCGGVLSGELYTPCPKCLQELKENAALKAGVRNLIRQMTGNPPWKHERS